MRGEVVDKLKTISKKIFDKKIDLTFSLKDNIQIVVILNKSLPGHHAPKQMTTKRLETDNLILKFKYNQIKDKESEILLDFLLNCNSTKAIPWREYILTDISISEDVEKEARRLLKEHIESLDEIYLSSVKEMIDSYEGSKTFLYEIWDTNVKYPTMKSLNKIKEYSKIKKEISYPYMVLSTPTSEVRLRENTNINLVKVEVMKEEVKLVDKMESLLAILIGDSGELYKLEKSMNYIDDKINSYIEEIKNNDKCSDNKDICCCENMFLSNLSITINYETKELLLGTDICNIKYNAVSEFENYEMINNFIKEIFNKALKDFDIKIKEFENKFKEEGLYQILKLIEDAPKKGKTTYVDILKGVNNSKIKSYEYHLLESYGTFKDFSKNKIIDEIDKAISKKMINVNIYNASFGRYEGLVLSSISEKYLRGITGIIKNKDFSSKIDVMNVDAFIKNINQVEGNNSKIKLINKLKENITAFNDEDIKKIIKFIEENRFVFREWEEDFIIKIAELTPAKYKDMYLLNANLSSGVTKNTFIKLYELM